LFGAAKLRDNLPGTEEGGSRQRGGEFPLFSLPVEALIDGGRLALAAVALLTIAIDPVQPPAWTPPLRALLVGYVVFAAILLAIPADRKRSWRLQFALHAIDIVVFSVLTYFSEGPTGRFAFYNFALVAATFRWSWRGALATSLALVCLLLLMLAFDAAPSLVLRHEPARLIMRVASLLVVGGMLACLGAYLDRSRDRLGQLAAWPREDLGDGETPALAAALVHATEVIGSEGIVVAWETGDEPFLKTVRSTGDSYEVDRYPTKRLADVVAPEVAGLSFYASRPDAGRVLLPLAGKPVAGPVILGDLAGMLAGVSFSSAPFEGGDVSGRVFILSPGPFAPGLLHLTEIVAARIGGELEQFGLRSALANAAILRERTRLARDLHDGLLQDLTAARLTIKSLTQSSSEPSRADLEEIAGMLGEHQRRIRDFVRAINPKPAPDWDFGAEFLTLTAMLERQWHCQVVAELKPPELALPGSLGYQVFLIFGEAMANAVQHGRSRRIAVEIEKQEQLLYMRIADDGRGLPQRPGSGAPAPFSLRQRVADLGGRLKLTSTQKGVELMIELPLS
jgi:signal transduction histidine kinase